MEPNCNLKEFKSFFIYLISERMLEKTSMPVKLHKNKKTIYKYIKRLLTWSSLPSSLAGVNWSMLYWAKALSQIEKCLAPYLKWILLVRLWLMIQTTFDKATELNISLLHRSELKQRLKTGCMNARGLWIKTSFVWQETDLWRRRGQ